MKKVLLINDDPDFQFLFTSYLQRKGFDAKTITASNEVMGLINDFHPEVIFIDMNAEIDGRIGTTVREQVKTGAKLVLLTDKTIDPSDVHKWNPDVVIQKPFRPSELLAEAET